MLLSLLDKWIHIMRKKLGSVILFLVLPAFFSFSYAAPAASPTIRWQPWSLSIFKRAKTEHKLILIFGKVAWCRWCQKMESSTFPDPRVVELIHKNFIPVKVDLEDDMAVSSRYRIKEIPSLIVLDEHNKELERFYGYSSPQGVLRELGGVLKQNS
jgi:thioredoxin-related protein